MYVCLLQCYGDKVLVLDEKIGPLLRHIVPEGSSLLRDFGVVNFGSLRGHHTDFMDAYDALKHVIFVVRPTLSQMRLLADMLDEMTAFDVISMHPELQLHVCFVPNRSMVCEQLLERYGLLEKVSILELPLGFVPMDTDFVSLETEFVFRQSFLTGDASPLASIAAALHRMQILYGPIPHVWGKGSGASLVVRRMLELRVEERETLAGWSDIEGLVILDRVVDLISPLVTPLTYESLVDEIIGIDNNVVKVPYHLISSKSSEQEEEEGSSSTIAPRDPNEIVTIPLNSSDAIYNDSRGMNIQHLASYFQRRASDLRNIYASFKQNKDASIPEVHDFVKTHMPDLTEGTKALSVHLGLMERLKETTDAAEFQEFWQVEQGCLEGEDRLDVVEELTLEGKAEDKYRILRLLALHSLSQGGIRASRYDAIRREIVQSYGFEMLLTLDNLEKVGLLKRRESRWVETSSSSSHEWDVLNRTLNLTAERVETLNPTDMAYVTSGYAPLSCRLVEAIGRHGGWNQIREALDVLPGPSFQFTVPEDFEATEGIPDMLDHDIGGRKNPKQTSSLSSAQEEQKSSASQTSLLSRTNTKKTKPVLFVFIVGGISYVEIAALRFLSNSESFPYTLLIGSTKTINGKSFLKSMVFDTPPTSSTMSSSSSSHFK